MDWLAEARERLITIHGTIDRKSRAMPHSAISSSRRIFAGDDAGTGGSTE
ncbi:MAG: hypothetical protein LBE10_01520 [Treponema sp.]|jgi:hypothetical protein|nr:hypothetical protein [Treponema sp.]